MQTFPQSGTPNTLSIDYAGNPDLQQLFGMKETGDKCTITLELQVMSKSPDGITLAIDKVISPDGYNGSDEEEVEAEPNAREPIMMTMMRKRASDQKATKENGMGPHNRPPQTAENRTEPGLTTFA